MQVLVTSGSGFLGTRLARALLTGAAWALAGATPQPITRWLLTDLAPPAADLQADPRLQFIGGDFEADHPEAVRLPIPALETLS